MVERYRRADLDDPNTKIVESWKSNDRIKQRSILKVAAELHEKHNLPENREEETIVNKFMPPSKDFCRADIKLETKVPVSKKKSDLMDVRTAGMETIQSYQEYEVQVYTDGSATNGTSRAGYGARIEHHDGTCERIAEPCGVHCSNFEAEAMAIQSAIDRVSQKCSDTVERVRVVIFLIPNPFFKL